jgi:nitrogen fixation NifU-like protein
MDSANNVQGWDNFMKLVEKMMIEKYGEILVDHANNPRNVGRLEDANGYASNTGECEETIEIWVKIIDSIIEEATFRSNGCEVTQAAGSMITELAKKKQMSEALKITPLQLIDTFGGLPDDHIHCAYLATNASHDAINNFKKQE